jgi:hypothetical protein
MKMIAFACAVSLAAGAAVAGAGEGSAPIQDSEAPAPAPDSNLAFLLGGWDVVATTPGTAESAKVSYDVRPFVGTTWLSGQGRSEALGLDSRDVWGRDAASGELMRIIFDGSGTYAVVRSSGWQGDKLVLEGDARSASGVVRVRETIRRLNDNEFVATWEAYRNGGWSAYSIERATRRAAAGTRC